MLPSPLLSPGVVTCCQCGERQPASSFLPAPHLDGGLTKRCWGCIRANSAAERAEREARQAARAAEAPQKATGGRRRRAATHAAPSPQTPASAAARRPAVEERTAVHV